MATYKEIIAQKEAVKGQLAEVRASEVSSVRGLMADYGLSMEAIAGRGRRGRPAAGARKAAAKPKAELPPKYQDPKTGVTWSGRRRAPAWLGKRPEKFLIAE